MLQMFLMLSCVLSVLVPETDSKSALRIIGGRDALVNEFPYVVQIGTRLERLKYNNSQKTVHFFSSCTGAALTTTWTLSARHCIPDEIKMTEKTVRHIDESTLIIRYGFPLGKPSADDRISKVLGTNKLKTDNTISTMNDVGLFQTEPIKIDKYAKISAIDFTTLYGYEVILAGFGLTKVDPNTIKVTFNLGKPLQVLDKVMLRSCEQEFPALCGAPSCGHWYTPCFGDSGGAVIHPSGVVGVISRGSACERYYVQTMSGPNNIITIVPTSPYIDWVHSITSGKQ